MYQKLVIVGRVGATPEKRFTPSGTAVTSFSVATGRSWTDKGGEKKDSTVWFRVSAWGQLADVCAKYLEKGKLVLVEGELTETKPYQAKDGTWRSSIDVTARSVQFLSPREDSGREDSAPREATKASSSNENMFDDSDEIPF